MKCKIWGCSRLLFFSFLHSHSFSISVPFLPLLPSHFLHLPPLPKSSQGHGERCKTIPWAGFGAEARAVNEYWCILKSENGDWRAPSQCCSSHRSPFTSPISWREGRSRFENVGGGVPLQFKHCEAVVLVVFFSVTASLICETLCLHLLPSQVLLHSKNP